MKKLMIAAAAAAMIGGAFATEYVYDFTASLKTTTGKYASSTTKTTYTVNCGKDANGTFWWDGADYADSAEAKKAVSKMSNEEKAEFAVDILGFDGEETEYNVKETYKGKDRWCYTFKYTVTDTDAACYRVAASRKLKDTVIVDDCCDGYGWEFEDGTEINWDLFYRFGGLTFAKATKVEVVADWAKDDSEEEFVVAGQGTWSDKLFKVDGEYLSGVKSISGSIVGILDNPDCEACCDYGSVATCFLCDSDERVEEPEGTAAYGTWSVKFNSKKSFK